MGSSEASSELLLLLLDFVVAAALAAEVDAGVPGVSIVKIGLGVPDGVEMSIILVSFLVDGSYYDEDVLSQ